MGFVPFYARNDLIDIMNLYKEQGITSFIIDFEGNNPSESWISVSRINKICKEIKEQYREDVYLHAFNIPFTRIKQKIDVTPAKDIITFTLGFDSYGTSHIPQKLPLHVIEKIKQNRIKKFVPWGDNSMALSYNSTNSGTEQTSDSFRIFNRNDYGYYRSNLRNIRESIREENGSIQLEEIFTEDNNERKRKSIRKAFNVEQQGLETLDLQKTIEENRIYNYLENKRYARDNLKLITKINQNFND
jgi:hypothetical protein